VIDWVGVEFASDLNALAQKDVRTYRNSELSKLAERVTFWGCNLLIALSRMRPNKIRLPPSNGSEP
jgi:hypothetical protein